MIKKSGYSLAARLILYTSVSIIVAVSVMGVLFTFFLNSRFRDYLILENQEVREELVSSLSQYLQNNSTIDQSWMENFSNLYMEQGMYFSLNTEDGEIMWSCLEDNSEMCNMHLDGSDQGNTDALQTESYDMPMSSPGAFAHLDVSFYPVDEYSGNDLFFLIETYKTLGLSMIISLIISAFSAVLLSKSMSRPLVSLARYSVRLANRDYSVSDQYQRGTTEIDDVHDAIQQLAVSLESQERLRKRLTSDISHELRTPLTSLQSTFEAMIDGIWDCDEERLKGCHEEVLRLSSLVSRLDDLNSYDSEIKTIIKSSVNIKNSVAKAFVLFENEFREKNFHWEITGDDIFLQADEGRLKQVWINLISNSLKFMRENGMVSVAVSGEDPVRIVFTDNGTGIEAEDLPNVFERFYKADSSRNVSGSGLGLSIVKEIISAHKGTISLQSIKNESTTFIIELPGDK